jgi:hypothetical protein
MYEMRIYYCTKYGYGIPEVIKRKYNMNLLNICMNSDYIITEALYPLFPMNSLQSFVTKYAKNKVVKGLIKMLWHIESLF